VLYPRLWDGSDRKLPVSGNMDLADSTRSFVPSHQVPEWAVAGCLSTPQWTQKSVRTPTVCTYLFHIPCHSPQATHSIGPATIAFGVWQVLHPQLLKLFGRLYLNGIPGCSTPHHPPLLSLSPPPSTVPANGVRKIRLQDFQRPRRAQ